MKVKLSEIKKNLHGTSSVEDEAETQTIWNTRKEKLFNKNSRKKKGLKK